MTSLGLLLRLADGVGRRVVRWKMLARRLEAGGIGSLHSGAYNDLPGISWIESSL